MYPLSLNLQDRLCVVIGGGAVATRKVAGLLEAGARVRLISPELTASLRGLADSGAIDWHPRAYRQGDLQGALLAFAATDDPLVQERVGDEAKRCCVLLNTADDPQSCDFQVPACLSRGELLIAVSTGGGSPAVAALVKRRLAREIGPEYAALLRLLATIRRQLSRRESSQDQRQALFRRLLDSNLLEWIAKGEQARIEELVYTVFGPDMVVDSNDLRLE